MGLTRLESYQYTWNKMVRLIYEEKKKVRSLLLVLVILTPDKIT